MKNVYFVLANKTYGKAMYLPYASACLAAYAWSFEDIRAAYNFGGILYKRDPIDTALAKLESPAVVAFTCYMWTIEYNKLLAQAIREKYPDCLIVFGGHDISAQREDAYPYVDVFVYGEGERPFCEILRRFAAGAGFAGVENIRYRENGVSVSGPRREYDTLDYPSPYLTGCFDAILRESPDVEFCATVETNRGCPYQCAYCDWCYTAKIRKFPIERVFAELEWCGAHRIEYVYCADGNFGILPRDMEIAEFAVSVKKKYGYPYIFNPCFAKNSNDTVYRISELLYANRMIKAVTLAYQTVCDAALKNINRKNFALADFAALEKRYVEAGIPTYTELILGLPGETYDSFCSGVCSLIEAGQQNAMTVYGCQVFANSLMGSAEYMEKFGIRTAHVKQSCIHVSPPVEGEIREYTDLVIETKDMPFSDMIRSILFCTLVQGFHHIGMLKYVAVLLHHRLGVSYRAFYDALLEYILRSEGTFLNGFFRRTEQTCSDLSNGEWTYLNDDFGDIGWYYEEGLFMETARNFEVFWAEIRPFLFSFPLEAELMEELCRYQKFVIRLPGQTAAAGIFAYDFYDYFSHAFSDPAYPLRRRRTTLEVTVPHPVDSWKEYGRSVMLFAKKKGATLIVSDRENVKVTYEDEA